jgi:UV DNA damage repair endonuclease
MTPKHLQLLSHQLHLYRLLDQLVPLVQHFQMHPLHLFLQLPH